MNNAFLFCVICLFSVVMISQASACPSASIIHGWTCVTDDECRSWEECDLWDHICRHKEGYCGVDLVCENPWQECDNVTHECSAKIGYCDDDPGCKDDKNVIRTRINAPLPRAIVMGILTAIPGRNAPGINAN